MSERRHLVVRFVTALALSLAGITLATSPGRGDSGEGAVAATSDVQRLLSLGAQHSCAITDAGTVECWGDNSYGQLGTGDTATSTTPRLVAGVTGALELASGQGHTCALIHGGTVRCWGLNGNGQIGDGTTDDRNAPVTVPGLAGVKHVAAGGFHTCALLGDGSAKCWGQDGMGQLGDGAPGDFSTTPTPVSGIDAAHPAADLTAGDAHTCARMVSLRLRCWGHNAFGQLGDGTTVDRSTPVEVKDPDDSNQPMTGVLAVTAGGSHTCALLDPSDEPVYCWGHNAYGQLGHQTDVDPATSLMKPSPVPLRVQIDSNADPSSETDAPMQEARSISAGQFHTCAVMATSAVRCWGQNGHGQLGVDRRPLTKEWEDSRWANVVPGLTAKGAMTGGFHTCAVVAASVTCWGYDFYGQLGGYRAQVPTPTTVTGVRGAIEVAASTNAACALVTEDPDPVNPDAKPFCWGSNADGRLGVGSLTPPHTTVPVPVAAVGYAAGLHGGNGSFCVRPDAASGPSCWGRNDDGELGDGTTTDRATPVVSTHLATTGGYDLGGTLVAAVEHGSTCSVSGGQARCWGYNGQGQLGDGTTTSTVSPVVVKYDADPDPAPDHVDPQPVTGVTGVATGGDHACAIVSGGQVRCWGANGVGQLGDNTTDARQYAVLVQKDTAPDADEPLTGATALVAGDSHTCALLGGGAVRCWGLNGSGQLGTPGGSRPQADKVVRAMTGHPLAVEADLTNASRFVSGDDHTCALRSDASLTCWGSNAEDQLGTGGGDSAVGQYSLLPPEVALPKPWIVDIAASRNNTCAALLDTTVSCWGDNTFGQVGDGIGLHSLAPVLVGGAAGFAGNHLPKPQDLTAETTPGTPVDIVVPLAGIDEDAGDTVVLSAVADPPLGSATFAGATITYTPDAACHDDTFAYAVSDGTAQVTAQVTVRMNCAPVASADSVTTAEDTAVDIDVLANDTDEDGDTLTVTQVVTQPADGTASVVAGKIHYVPDPDACAPPVDTLVYEISDGHGHTATETVGVTVTCAPDGPAVGADAASTPEDTEKVVDVLANDGDADGDPLTVASVGAPAHGTTSTDGTAVRYRPAENYCGPDSFTYVATDGSLDATGTVTMTVVCASDSPRPGNDAAATPEDTSVDIDVLANDTDPDGPAPTLTGDFGQPAHGTVQEVSGKVRYTPDADYCGPDPFSYVVTDGALTATGQVDVRVTCVNDLPVAVPDAATTPEDTIVHIHVVTNDVDVDGDMLTVKTIGTPAQGTAVGAVDNAVAYTPDTNWCGDDSFTYTVVDPSGLTGPASTTNVTVHVDCVDDPVKIHPVADTSTQWGVPVAIGLGADDVDGEPIAYTLVSGPDGATVAGGIFTWTPASGQVGVRAVTVRASSGGVDSETVFHVVVTKRATTLAYDGPTSGVLSDASPVRAVLRDALTNDPVAGRTVGFTLGAATAGAVTDSVGTADAAIAVASPPGTKALAASFAGDPAWAGSSASVAFTVAKESLGVQLGGSPLVVTSAASASPTYTAELVEDPDGTYAGLLGTVTVRFERLDGSLICSATASPTTAGRARVTCSAAQPVGALPLVVRAVSGAYTGWVDVAVVTVANPGTDFASGAGRVQGDDFGFQARPVRKAAPAGNAIHVVNVGSAAQVVSSTALSSLTSSCTTKPKVCKATVAATSASVQQVDLATGAVSPGGPAALVMDVLGTDRYAVSVTGSVSRTLGSAANPVQIDFGLVRPNG